MNTTVKNPFLVGPIVTGDSFIGREKECTRLANGLFESKQNFALVAPTRAGKSSLLYEIRRRAQGKYPNILMLFLSVADADSAFHFWCRLCDELEAAYEELELDIKKCQRQFNNLHTLMENAGGSWYIQLNSALRKLLKALGEAGYRITLFLDEFDHTSTIFQNESAYYQLLRSILYEPDLYTNGIIASRKGLAMYEIECPNISTLHGIFQTVSLHAFSDKEMETYYQKLSSARISLTSGGKKRLKRYTGCLPYLCAMMGNQMVINAHGPTSFGDDGIDAIYRKVYSDIVTYYADLYKRLEADDHLSFVWFLAMGMQPPQATRVHYDNMQSMGVLTHNPQNQDCPWYSYTPDFMDWLRVQPMLKMDITQAITACEKKLRQMLIREYPPLGILVSQVAQNATEQKTLENALGNEVSINWYMVETNYSTLRIHNPQVTLADCMGLTWDINQIEAHWTSRFSKYFFSTEKIDWVERLHHILSCRHPASHANIDYVDNVTLSACVTYCTQIAALQV